MSVSHIAKKWAYYNDADEQKLAWVKELIKAGVVTDGELDSRPIQQVSADDVRGFRRVHWFCGIAIWDYALNLARWGDAECWTGSCPCPSFSAAGKGGGFSDPRHLWPNWFQLIRELRPAALFGEQVAAAIGHGWLDLVQTDLEGADYAVGAAVLGACSVGAPHIRQRLYFCANSQSVAGRLSAGQWEDRAQFGGRSETGLGAHAGQSEPARRRTRSAQAKSLESYREFAGCGSPSDGGSSAGLSLDSNGGEPSNRGIQRSGEQRLLAEDCGTGDGCDTEERGQSMCGSPSGIARHAALSGATRGFWSGCDWWYGKDGKYRPIGEGITPLISGPAKSSILALASRLTSDIRLLRDSGDEELQTSEARVLRLKGYGDAICGPLAAEFIGAYMETL